MESLGDILRRLQQQSTSAAAEIRAELEELLETQPAEPPCPICGGRGWVRRDVSVGSVDFGKALACVCQEQANAEQRSARLRRFSNMGVLAQITFPRSETSGYGVTVESRTRFRAAFDIAEAFAENPTGWITFLGASGAGKTHLAAAIANRCMEKGAPVFFAFVPDLLDHLRTAFDPESPLSYDELFDQVRTIPVLVLDDLGAQSGTGWAEEKLFQILNHRYISALPTVITTTIGMDHQEERVRSRLMDARISRIVDLGNVSRSGGPGIGAVEPELLKSMAFDQFQVSTRSKDRGSQETLQAAFSAARSFADHPDGWLVLLGNPGCGKTHLAVAIAKQRIEQGEDVFFAFVPDLLDYLRYTFSPDSRITYDELFDRVKRTPLLILDDLGSESTTAWANEKLYQIVVHRHNARLPTIITTRGLPNTTNDPIASRLEDPRVVVVVPITAPDFRQQGIQQTHRSGRTGPDGRVR